MTSPDLSKSNFYFLAEYDVLFLELAQAAERAFTSDPNTTLIKLRQLGEALAQNIAVLAGIEFDEQTTQADLLYKINRELKLEPVVRELFHTLRVEGNKATHQFKTQHKEAISGLVVARKLAIWFNQSFGQTDHEPLTRASKAPFVTKPIKTSPPASSDTFAGLHSVKPWSLLNSVSSKRCNASTKTTLGELHNASG